MKKALGLFAFGMIVLLGFVSLSSALTYYGGYFDPYYGAGDYDAYSSYTSRTSGGFYGPRTTTTTAYDKVSEKFMNPNGKWVDRTTYVREKVESPYYYSSGGYYNQPYYGGPY
ncbi:MAG: hypothetical protein ACFFDT_36730, partial [Candidatus Hodarchaeota archaeon]